MTSLAWVSLFSNTFTTRSAFIMDLRTRVDEDSTSTGAISDTQFIRVLYHGMNNINYLTGLLPEYCEVTADGSQSYTLPAGFTKLRSVYHIGSGNVYTQLSRSNLSEAITKSNSSAVPDLYYRLGNNIYLNPYGITSGTIRVYGSRIPTAPSGDTINIDLPQEYIELLFLWSEWQYFKRKRIPDEANAVRDLYLSMCLDISKDIENNYSEGGTLYGS